MPMTTKGKLETWPVEKLDTLDRLLALNTPLPAIARELGENAQAVRQKMDSTGRKYPSASAANRANMLGKVTEVFQTPTGREQPAMDLRGRIGVPDRKIMGQTTGASPRGNAIGASSGAAYVPRADQAVVKNPNKTHYEPRKTAPAPAPAATVTPPASGIVEAWERAKANEAYVEGDVVHKGVIIHEDAKPVEKQEVVEKAALISAEIQERRENVNIGRAGKCGCTHLGNGSRYRPGPCHAEGCHLHRRRVRPLSRAPEPPQTPAACSCVFVTGEEHLHFEPCPQAPKTVDPPKLRLNPTVGNAFDGTRSIDRPTLQQLLAGVFPKPGTLFPVEQRAAFLRMCVEAFNLAYGSGGGDIQVRIWRHERTKDDQT